LTLPDHANAHQPEGGQGQVDATGKKHATSETETQEQALEWERRLSAGDWRGAAQPAEVVVQPAGDVVTAAAVRAQAQALACFAESRPLVQPAERETVEGVPDWVDNIGKLVRIMTTKGWWAPEKVLLDGGSYYSMAGARLKARLGLGPADMDTSGHKVQTAMGKVETLPGGLTKEPIPIILNAGTADEVCLFERLAFTESSGYDLLIGTRAAYPYGLSVDRWAEKAVYRVDRRTGGEQVGRLPMKIHQEKPGAWVTVVKRGQRAARGAQAPQACCLTSGKEGPGGTQERGRFEPRVSVPARHQGEKGEKGGKRADGRRSGRWPRGPWLDTAAEAERAVADALLTPRRKAEKYPNRPAPAGGVRAAGSRPGAAAAARLAATGFGAVCWSGVGNSGPGKVGVPGKRGDSL
jgi:hypothetical protein